MICVCGDCSSVVFAETNSRLALSPRFDVAPSVTDALDCTWQMWSRKLPKWWSIHTPPLYTVYYSIIFNQFETRISLTYPWGITGDPNDISMESMGISYFSHRARRWRSAYFWIARLPATGKGFTRHFWGVGFQPLVNPCRQQFLGLMGLCENMWKQIWVPSKIYWF